MPKDHSKGQLKVFFLKKKKNIVLLGLIYLSFLKKLRGRQVERSPMMLHSNCDVLNSIKTLKNQ